MTTSNSTNFTLNANDIIEDALRELGVIREDETPDPGDCRAVLRRLNMMVKTWQAQDLHLWTKETAIIFLQKGQNTYTLNSTSSDHATIDYEKTTLDADYALGVSQVSFNDDVSATAGDLIGIELDSGSLYWDIISNVVDSDTVDLTGTLPSAASSSKLVYIYTTPLDQPFNVLSAVRSDRDETDIEVSYNSYEQYFNLPSKDSLSTPVIYNYDRQRDSAVIRVWPTPADVSTSLKITILRKIQDFDIGTNTPDFPQEWQEALVLNLAVKVSGLFGKRGTQKYQDLKLEAETCLALVMGYDNEPGSIYNQIDNRNYGEY